MPIYTQEQLPYNTQFLVWEIDETEDWLEQGIQLTALCMNRLSSMKSMVHRKGFLSVRHLLKALGYAPIDVHYDSFGKPHLTNGKYISISHSHTFSAVAVSDMPIGIDIEKERSKIHRIATKFLHTSERLSDETDRFRTTQWCIKEAAYKVFGKKGVSFLHHIRTTHMNAQHPITEVIADSGIVKLKNWTYHWPGFSCALSIKEQ